MESQSRGGFELACEMSLTEQTRRRLPAAAAAGGRTGTGNLTRGISCLAKGQDSLDTAYASTRPYHQQTVQIHERS